MASAGHAQAHSSQPTHFSRPSGHRLSWWRPWKRGAVAFFSNGYCSVTTLRNVVRKVTPKPATGSQNCSRRLATDRLLSRSRRHRVTAGERVFFGCVEVGGPGLGVIGAFSATTE